MGVEKMGVEKRIGGKNVQWKKRNGKNGVQSEFGIKLIVLIRDEMQN